MMPFYGDKSKPKILGTINTKNFYWDIDTGSAVTCMNINSFETAFGRKLKIYQKCKKKEKVYTHCENYRRIQWKYPGHRLSAKTPITLWSKDPANMISTNSIKSHFRNQKLHPATIHNYPGTGKVIPNNQRRTKLYHRHWGSKTPLDIRTINLGYLRWEQSLHHPATKLRTTWNQHWDRRHIRHCQYRNHDSNSTRRWQPHYHLRTNLPTTAKSQEENMDQKRNWEKMSSWGTRTLPEQVHRHPVQAPGCHQHGQKWCGLGKRFYQLNPSQRR